MATPPSGTLDSLSEGCQVISRDYRYLYLNSAAAVQGRRPRDELLGKRMVDEFPGIDHTPMWRVLQRCMDQRVPAWMENEFHYPDGGVGWFELRFEPVPEGVFILSLDVTERKRSEATQRRLEDDLRQVRKMETVGQLAGGIAHDFNNLLAVIIAYTDVALESAADNPHLRADLLHIREAGQQAAALTRQLLAFGRRQVLAPRVLDLNAVLGGLSDLLRRLLGEDVELALAPGTELGAIRADPVQLQQVLMNLAANARDAMPQGGCLTLATENITLDGGYASTHVDVTPGPYVMLAVSDTGAGMDAATRERIFEPFFTTKPPGRGTGLGLATVYGIVKQSGGSIWVYSEPGQGTTFKLYFPRVDAPVEPLLPRAAVAGPETLAGTETILLVEDSRPVREITRRILLDSGYTVLTAANGPQGIVLCERHDGPVHLLLTDVVMPGLTGVELASRLAVLKPELKALFMSGYTDDALVHQGVLGAETHFLGKPFDALSLRRKVREVLGGAGARG
jgi:signal transduction histidine kinase/CheY-like chemotaxis protein